MSYADFTYYEDTYLGNVIAEADFPRLALRASAQIDRLTFGRAATDTDNETAIKNAMCAVAEEIYAIENSDNSEYVTSESQGQYSVSYDPSSVEGRTDTERYSDAAKLYLENTGLMFGGFNSDEYGAVYDT